MARSHRVPYSVEAKEVEMLQIGSVSPASASSRTLLDRVEDALAALTCTAHVWVRGAGRHVLLGLAGQEEFARVTALGGGSYGLAFHGGMDGRWELLLVDDLRSVIEHALVGGNALAIDHGHGHGID